MNIIQRFATGTLMLCALAGCTAQHLESVRDDDARVTVGTVQKEIRVGTPAADVAGILGSPNIVTNDEENRQTWIYDKISREVAYSRSSAGVAGLVFGGSGGGIGTGSASGGATRTTQRTLTVVIKFDRDERVRDFAYHTSRF
jgi:outer membrane protein assembly factor BamE (lipoprotein component of BamABCDE complex)